MGKEKKEIGKLIELLNEYEPYIASDGEHKPNLWGYAYQGHSAIFPKELAESYIISARYGFVKWLVENDKIDFRKADADISKDIVLGREPDFMDFMIFRRFADYEKVLMLLSISDTPIEFLCEILK